MEPVFINHCALNKKNLAEMAKHTRRGARVIVNICSVLLLLVGDGIRLFGGALV